MKNYLLVLFGVLCIGIFSAPFMPEIKSNLSLDETSQLDKSSETVLLSEISEVPKADLAKLTDTAKTATSVVSSKPVSSGSKKINGYTVTRFTKSLVKSPTYSDIYRTGNLVYAHNSANLFGNLKYLGLGSIFTLTENGVTTTYRVSSVEYFKKVSVPGGEDLARCNGLSDDCSGRWMSGIVKNAIYHNVALMTCAGKSYGNGDASHRLIILADKI